MQVSQRVRRQDHSTGGRLARLRRVEIIQEAIDGRAAAASDTPVRHSVPSILAQAIDSSPDIAPDALNNPSTAPRLRLLPMPLTHHIFRFQPAAAAACV